MLLALPDMLGPDGFEATDKNIQDIHYDVAELVRLGSKQGPERPGDEELIMRCANEPDDILIMHGGGTGGRYSAIIDTTGYRIRTRKISAN